MTTDLSSNVTDILNASIQAVENAIPGKFELRSPTVTSAPIEQTQLGVIIGLTGEGVRGRFFVSSTAACFAQIGKEMYGTDLDDKVVLSFASEFANMFAGNMSRIAEHFHMGISPPQISLVPLAALIFITAKAHGALAAIPALTTVCSYRSAWSHEVDMQ